MSEVSGQVLRFFRDLARLTGIAYEELIASIPGLDPRQTPARMSWETYVALWNRSEALGARPPDIEEAGRMAVRHALGHPLQAAAKGLGSARAAYYAAVTWLGPSLFRNLEFAQESGGNGSLRIVIEIPAHYRACPGFFRSVVGALREMPALVGRPEALVAAELGDRRGVFNVTPPPSTPARTRVRRVWTALTAGAGAVRALSDQQSQLDDSYAALVRSQQDLQRVIESIPDGVIIHRAGTILFANPAWDRCLGFVRADKAVGCKLANLVDPEDRAAVAAWTEPHDERGDVAPREYRFLRRDGAAVTLEISAAQRVEFAGAPGSLVVARDVTERKRAETTVRGAEKQLELKLARADRLVALGTLAAGVAHEISNPLSYVMLNLETILEQVRSVDAAALPVAGATGELALQALEGAQRVRLIVNELKTLSRGEDRATGPVNLATVLAWSLNVADHQIRHRARLVRDFRKVPLTTGNEARLGQVFLNLLINAAQSIPEGHAAANEICVTTRTDDAGRAVVEVRDTGCGIPPESLDRIFDPFFTTQPIGQGSGLGLAICHNIVTELHGDIEVESAVGTGTTFRVRLPALAAPPPPPPKPPEVPAPRRARILIIDDDVQVGRALGHVLRRHELSVVSNGRDALDRLERETYDVIFCDMMMPDLSGIDIYEALRDRQPGLEKRIVFMTGGAFTTDARSFLASVPNRCIEKPFARAAIDQAIGALVGV